MLKLRTVGFSSVCVGPDPVSAHIVFGERMNERYLPVCQIDLVPQHHHGVGLLHWNDFGQNITPPGIQGFKRL